jgi:hypothetical protein
MYRNRASASTDRSESLLRLAAHCTIVYMYGIEMNAYRISRHVPRRRWFGHLTNCSSRGSCTLYRMQVQNSFLLCSPSAHTDALLEHCEHHMGTEKVDEHTAYLSRSIGCIHYCTLQHYYGTTTIDLAKSCWTELSKCTSLWIQTLQWSARVTFRSWAYLRTLPTENQCCSQLAFCILCVDV